MSEMANNGHHGPSAHGRDRLAFSEARGAEKAQASPSPQWRATMKLPRREFLHLAAGAAALPVPIASRFGAGLSDTAGACCIVAVGGSAARRILSRAW